MRVTADPQRMRASAQALAHARARLHHEAAAVARMAPPAYPLDLSARIAATLRRTAQALASAEDAAHALSLELDRRARMAEIADGADGRATPDGLFPGLFGDLLGAALGGFEEFAARYARIWRVAVERITLVRTVATRVTVTVRDGRRLVVATSTRLRHSVAQVTRVAAGRLPHAGGIRLAGRAFGVIGHVDNAVGVYRAFHTKGPHRNAAIGGAIGKAGGGWAGAATGAAIGAAFGGPIGAGVGALVGGLAGSQLGKTAGEFLGSKAKSIKGALGKVF